MYRPRRIESRPDWEQADGIKLYSISATGAPVEPRPFLDRLALLLQRRPDGWPQRPAFAIFHAGATGRYLVLAWWDHGNELFVSVSFDGGAGWIEDRDRHSFCLYDLEVIWAERNFYVEHIDCAQPDLAAYRARRFSPSL